MITFKNLSKKFEDTVLFKDFNIQIKAGEMVAIWGESGCGKTTLLNIMGLLDRDYEGEYRLNHKVIKAKRSDAISRIVQKHIVYLFQNYALIDDKSIFYNLNLAFFKKMTRRDKIAKMEAVMGQVGLMKKLDMPVFKLSGGEQQRLAIARGLLLDRDVYLCDEPTGNLDGGNAKRIMDLLVMIHQQGKTVIVVTHDEKIAARCQRVIKVGS